MKTFRSVSAFSWVVMLAGATALASSSQGQREEALREIRSSPLRCPLITVSCPSEARDGEPIVFSATIKDADPGAVLSYNWSVDKGTIVEGQGTHTIKLKSAGVSSWTATLKVGGLNPSCASTASCTLSIGRPQLRRRFASYEVPGAEEINKLGSFAETLKNERWATGYILSYAPRGRSADDAKAIADRAKAYLISEHNIDPDRIVTVEAGVRDHLIIELWTVPAGAVPPTAAENEDPGAATAPTEKKTNPTRR